MSLYSPESTTLIAKQNSSRCFKETMHGNRRLGFTIRNHKEHIRLLYLARKKYSTDSMRLTLYLQASPSN